MRTLLLIAALWFGGVGPVCALPQPALAAARAYVHDHEREIVAELRALLALPNNAAEADDIRRNAHALVGLLEQRGAVVQILETPGGAPAVFAEIASPGATKTLMFYAHFDGQPAGDRAAWRSDPFDPTLRLGALENGAAAVPWSDARYPLPEEARIYARSASDDKGPIIAMLAALDAVRAANIPLSVNVKFFLEGEEEAGSPNLARTLQLHRETLAADLWMFGDGPIDPRGLPRAVLGARGVASFAISVFGPATSVHSGHYGNVATNPASALAHLIASMRDEEGRILIRGFENGARPSRRSRAMAAQAFDTDTMLRGPVLARTESGLSYGESILRPALNVTQLSYGGIGAARNAIDPVATASFDIRLTPGLTPEAARMAVERHLRAQGYTLVADEPTPAQRRQSSRLARLQWGELGYPAAASAPDDAGVARLLSVLQIATDDAVRIAPLLGGSLPIAPITEVLGAPFVVVPIVNPDNNQHAPNENLRMREFRTGIELYAAVLADLGEDW